MTLVKFNGSDDVDDGSLQTADQGRQPVSAERSKARTKPRLRGRGEAIQTTAGGKLTEPGRAESAVDKRPTSWMKSGSRTPAGAKLCVWSGWPGAGVFAIH